jgi:hypothetical protein
MSSKDLRPSSAQSRTAWGDYGSGGHARPDNQFDFGPRDDPDNTRFWVAGVFPTFMKAGRDVIM